MSITYTQTDLDNLKIAYLSNTLEVRIGDRMIRYESSDKIKEKMIEVQRYLAGTSPSASSPKLIQATFSKGQS